MLVKVHIDAYNHKRFSRPWISVILSWPIGKSPDNVKFGKWVGDCENGGHLEIEAQEGNIIKWGQKDFWEKEGVSKWGAVNLDGTVEEIDASQARDRFGLPVNRHEILSQFSNQELLDELKVRQIHTIIKS